LFLEINSFTGFFCMSTCFHGFYSLSYEQRAYYRSLCLFVNNWYFNLFSESLGKFIVFSDIVPRSDKRIHSE
jgi:hypothetical protein